MSFAAIALRFLVFQRIRDALAALSLRQVRVRTRSYSRNAGVEVVTTALGILSGVLIARLLGPEGRGQYAAAMLWAGLACTLLSFGLQQAAAYAAAASWRTPGSLHRLALVYSVGVGVPGTALYWLLSPWIFSQSFGEATWVPAVHGLFIPLALYAGILMPIYQGRGDFRRWNAVRLFRAGAWSLSVLIFASLKIASVLLLLIAQIAIHIFSNAYLFSQFHRLTTTGSIQELPFGRLLRYGLAVYLGGLAYMVNHQLDQLLLSLWVPPFELGYYATAASLAGVLFIIPSAIGPIMFTKMAQTHDVISEQRRHALHALVLSAGLLFPSGILLALIAKPLVRIFYGEAFGRSGDILWVLALASAFLGLAQIMAEVLRGANRPMLATYGTVAGGILTVTGLVFALPRFGIWGAAWVSLASYALVSVIQGIAIWRWAKAA